MAAEQPHHPVPAGLTGSGRALYESVAAEFVLDGHELAILLEAARTASRLDALEALIDREGLMSEGSQGSRIHPAATEQRLLRPVLTRLLAALELSDDGTATGGSGRAPGIRGVV